MRTDGIFIGIEVEDEAVAREPALASHLSQVCPVDIYHQTEGGGLEIVERNLDECVLCRLCLDAVESDPTHPVKVIKLYDDGAILS